MLAPFIPLIVMWFVGMPVAFGVSMSAIPRPATYKHVIVAVVWPATLLFFLGCVLGHQFKVST